MLSRGDIHDPGIGFITLTRVVVSPDLQQARVFYTTMGDAAARKATSRALDRATPYMRRQIGSRLRLRRVPELEFRFDQSIEHQDRVERIIRDLHEHPPEPLDPAYGTTTGDSQDAGRDERAAAAPHPVPDDQHRD